MCEGNVKSKTHPSSCAKLHLLIEVVSGAAFLSLSKLDKLPLSLTHLVKPTEMSRLQGAQEHPVQSPFNLHPRHRQAGAEGWGVGDVRWVAGMGEAHKAKCSLESR